MLVVQSLAERELHSLLDCRFIVSLYRAVQVQCTAVAAGWQTVKLVLQDGASLQLVLECCQGGDLWTLLHRQHRLHATAAR